MNDSDDTQNPFAWMPKAGQSKKIPGGVLWCDEWEVSRQHGNSRVSGMIRFRFEADMDSYERANKPQATMKLPPLFRCTPLEKGKLLVELAEEQKERSDCSEKRLVSRSSDARPLCKVCGIPGCLEVRGPNFHDGPAFGSKKCDYTGTPPFADAEWAGTENDALPNPFRMCEWCAGTGHPHGDESYGMCECPALSKNADVDARRDKTPNPSDG
jgi:hypothetical protein